MIIGNKLLTIHCLNAVKINILAGGVKMSNFDFLNERFSELSKLGELAEKNIYIDSSTSLVKLRIFGEYIVKYIIKLEGLDKRAPGSKGKQFNRIKILKKNELLPQEIEDILQILRKKGNPAAHEVYENIEDAKESLRLAYELAVWFMKVYVDDQFICKEFVMPESQLIQSDLKKIEQEYKVQVINLEKELNDLKSLNYSLKKEEREKIKLLRIEDAKNQAKKIDLTDFNKEISDLHKDLKLQQQNFNKKMAIVIIIILFTSLGTILINKYNIKNTLENIDSKRVNTSNRNQEKLIEDENKERILLENYSVTNKSIKETIKSDDGKVDLFIYDIQYPYIECEEDNQIISYLNNKFKENAKKIYNENLDIVSECIDIYNDIKDEMSGTWSAYTVNSIIDIKYNKNGRNTD